MLFLGTDVTSFTIHSLAFFQIFSTVIFDFSVLLFHRFSLDLIRTKIESNSRWVAVKSLQLHYRDSHWRCSIRKYVPKNYVIFTEIHQCWSLLLIKRDSNYVFSWECCEIFKNIIFIEQLQWLLLKCTTILQLESSDSYYTAIWYHTFLRAPMKGASAIHILIKPLPNNPTSSPEQF